MSDKLSEYGHIFQVKFIASLFKTSQMPLFRHFSSTTTSSIQALLPVGILKRTKVSEPTISPSIKAASSIEESEVTISSKAERSGGELEFDSCGTNRFIASTSLSSTFAISFISIFFSIIRYKFRLQILGRARAHIR